MPDTRCRIKRIIYLASGIWHPILMKPIRYLILIFLFASFFSCKRNGDKITTDPQAKLRFSTSEITFDTIFTSVGSVTQRLWVYNENKHAVMISTIELARLYTSSYKILIDGEEQVMVNNYELKGKDSMMVLVKVLIDPQNHSLPYLVDDSIVFITNGNVQDVDLQAYGQDAFFLNNTTVACNTIWTNTKPYVLSGNITVPAGCTLTIDKGTRVRFHKNATLTVAGTLITQGLKDSIITFRHDNLSGLYDDLPGQWGGVIFLTGSKNNQFVYTEIKNAINGLTLQAEPDADTIAEVMLANCTVKNCSGNAITATSTDFYAVNSLIGNSAGYLFKNKSGGNYYFDFCTFENYSQDFFRNAVSLRFSNYDDTSGAQDLNTIFRNTIVWGDKSEEFETNDNNTNVFNLIAHYSLLASSSAAITGTNTIFNTDPQFDDPYSDKFMLNASSPAVNSGMVISSITIDLKGNARDAMPDRGCYER
ncbi:MAG TPA: hypothetical protein VNB90_08135 [Cytophagaceae bacterium]|nr:hypothetical protein [Cytophagaceae bacterium]